MAAIHVGLISGTSMDGIDAVVVDLAPRPVRLLAAQTVAFSSAIQTRLDALRQDPDRFPLAELGRLDALLGDALAAAALAVIGQADVPVDAIEAIGSHGQTVLHRVEASPPHTLQIGDASRIAEATGIVTVSDFRRADVAAGGQGAPLAPLIHEALLASEEECRLVINLGGIGNLTRLVPGQATQGFDTGPANCFLDLWYRRFHEGRFDSDGRWASKGQVDADWLATLLEDPYFSLAPPKSTGIEYFSAAWLEARLPDWALDRPQAVQATLAEFSAASLAKAALPMRPDRVLLCGGGVENTDLVERLRRRLGPCPVESTDDHGLPAHQVEAVLFAWLAQQRLAARPLATGSVTGARHPVVLGSLSLPPGRTGRQ
jgi:anhydro-N-acetylmuramic acid kinase